MGQLTPILGIPRMFQRMEEAENAANLGQNIIEVLLKNSVKSRTTSAEPGSPSNGDSYILPSGATGTAWSIFTAGNIVYYYSGWYQLTRKEGMRVLVEDEDCYVEYDGTGWYGGVETGITASATQSQGQQPLTREFNEVITVTTANDVVTLPEARAGRRCVVANAGASTLQIFPASGDSIDNGSVDASVTLAAGSTATFYGLTAVKWYRNV